MGDYDLQQDRRSLTAFAASRRDFLIKAAGAGAAAVAGLTPQVGIAQMPAASTPPNPGQTREYWIGADSMLWNLVPNGRDDITGAKYQPNDGVFPTVGYRAYSPNWVSVLASNDSIGENEGIPGPVIRARVGDTIVIHLKNNDLRPRWSAHSLHMQGLVHEPENNGFWYGAKPDLPGTAIYPGESYTYRYTVPKTAAGTWLYYDQSASRRTKIQGGLDMRIYRAVPVYTRAQPQDPDELDAPTGAQHGLFGMVVIEDEHTPPADRENIVLLHDIYAEDFPMLAQDFDCINGRSFLYNTPTFHAKLGERIRWRVGVIGRESHVFHIHGHRWLTNGRSTDTHILSPGTTATFEYKEDAVGTWLYHCHLTEHMMGGMAGEYIVA